ncbi:MAG: cholesterol oxidase substrate-binding domain-containing protein, partial [Nevskiales bacterium]
AYTEQAAWSDPAFLVQAVPGAFPAEPGHGWDWARKMLNHYDPHRVFSNGLLDTLLP